MAHSRVLDNLRTQMDILLAKNLHFSRISAIFRMDIAVHECPAAPSYGGASRPRWARPRSLRKAPRHVTSIDRSLPGPVATQDDRPLPGRGGVCRGCASASFRE